MAYISCLLSVFPTCVGISPELQEKLAIKLSIPHIRGGKPEAEKKAYVTKEYSPCVWG